MTRAAPSSPRSGLRLPRRGRNRIRPQCPPSPDEHIGGGNYRVLRIPQGSCGKVGVCSTTAHPSGQPKHAKARRIIDRTSSPTGSHRFGSHHSEIRTSVSRCVPRKPARALRTDSSPDGDPNLVDTGTASSPMRRRTSRVGACTGFAPTRVERQCRSLPMVSWPSSAAPR